MYNQKLAVAVKTNGTILREFGDVVYLPFGSEYSLFLKNLHTVRACVKVSIDGVDVTEGVHLVIGGNESIDLERFIKSGNLNAGNKFKFLKMSGAVAAHRGVKAEDGLIRVEYQFERLYYPVYVKQHYGWHENGWKSNDDRLYRSAVKGIVAGGANSLSFNSTTAFTSSTVGSAAPQSHRLKQDVSSEEFEEVATASAGEAGFTAEGGLSDQQFNMVGSFALESEKHVIVLKLLGATKKAKVRKAVTVKTKFSCPSCGKSNRAANRFCSGCGTGLEIAA